MAEGENNAIHLGATSEETGKMSPEISSDKSGVEEFAAKLVETFGEQKNDEKILEYLKASREGAEEEDRNMLESLIIDLENKSNETRPEITPDTETKDLTVKDEGYTALTDDEVKEAQAKLKEDQEKYAKEHGLLPEEPSLSGIAKEDEIVKPVGESISGVGAEPEEPVYAGAKPKEKEVVEGEVIDEEKDERSDDKEPDVITIEGEDVTPDSEVPGEESEEKEKILEEQFERRKDDPEALRKWYHDNMDNMSDDMLGRVRGLLGIGTVVEAVEASVEIDDQKRMDFMDELDKILFSGAAISEPVSAEDVEMIMARLSLPKEFSNEALALMEFANASAAKGYFLDRQGLFFKDKKDMSQVDLRWKDLFVLAYQNKQLKEILKNPELDGASEVMVKIIQIMDLTDRNADTKEFNLKSIEDKELFDSIQAIDHRLASELLAIGNGVVTTVDFERRLVSLATVLLKDEKGIEINDFQGRMGFMLYEGFAESELNKRHPLFQLTHTSEYADTALKLGFWLGSFHWWDRDLISRMNLGYQVSNLLPERIWKSPLMIHAGLREAVLDGRGVDAIRGLLSAEETELPMDGGVLTVKRATKPGEGIVSKVSEAIAKGGDVMKNLTEFGSNAESSLIDEQVIWNLLGNLSLCNGVDNLDSLRMVEAASLVLFKEISVNDINADKDVGGKNVRAVSPFGLWERYTRLATARRTKAEAGKPEIYAGIFDILVKDEEGVNKIEDPEAKRRQIQANIRAKTALKVVRDEVMLYIHDYKTKDGGKWLERIPEAEKVFTSVLEIGLPDISRKNDTALSPGYVKSYNDELQRLKELAGASTIPAKIEAATNRVATLRQDIAHKVIPGNNPISKAARWLVFGSK